MRRLAFVHGAFNVVTGLWPVIDIESFEAVTGPKVDRWLVKTVGLLLGVIGAAEIRAAASDRPRDAALLGAGTSAALFAIDVTYVAKRRISLIYLGDAAMQLAFVAAWAVAGAGARDAAA